MQEQGQLRHVREPRVRNVQAVPFLTSRHALEGEICEGIDHSLEIMR